MQVIAKRVIFAATLVALGLGAYAFAYADDRRVLQHNLRLRTLPASVQRVQCESRFTSDVITDCYLTIDPREFELLLTGYSFREYRPGLENGGNTFFDAGTAFHVDRIYNANISGDPEFPHGGNVLIYVNADRTRVRSHYYAE